MWNERYTVDEYIYGTEPNSFLAISRDAKWACTILAEGEGRMPFFSPRWG